MHTARACASPPHWCRVAGWNNIIDHFGWTHMFNENDLKAPTDRRANETTLFNVLRPRGCAASQPGEQTNRPCLRVGFLPHDVFPRITDQGWAALEPAAAIHHIAGDGSLGEGFSNPIGVKPFRGHRQRLDRCVRDQNRT